MKNAIQEQHSTVFTREMEDFKLRLSGDLLQRGDDNYDVSRKIWNGMIDKYPALIARCINKEDIVNSVNFARKNNLVIAVKGGGHNVTGNAVCQDGLMIDLSQMNSIKVDPAEQTAIVQSGATWGDFDKAAQEHGLATTGGIISSTGVAGLTLGGGVGWLVRKHGLSCDNLLEVEMVTADGKVVVANENENAELFWGVRGCAPNFGVVVTMKFKLHQVPQVLGGLILYPQSEAGEVIRFFREFIKTAPEELTMYANLLYTPDGLPVIGLAGMYCGDIEKGQAVLQPLRDFKQPLADLIQPIPYTQMQTLIDGGFPHGNRYYWKSCFLNELSDEAIDTIVTNVATIPSPYSATVLEFYGGAASRTPPGGTSYPHRQAEFNLVIISHWQQQDDDEKNISWTRNFFEDMQQHSSKKVYVNTLGKEGQDRVREAYGENYDRLLQLKIKYDPYNLFKLNQNITPPEAQTN